MGDSCDAGWDSESRGQRPAWGSHCGAGRRTAAPGSGSMPDAHKVREEKVWTLTPGCRKEADGLLAREGETGQEIGAKGDHSMCVNTHMHTCHYMCHMYADSHPS